MSKSALRHRKVTRKNKIENGETFKINEKLKESTISNIPRYTATTENQKKALAYLRSGMQVVGLFGSAGTGKSMLAAYWAATQLASKNVNKIILLRPNSHCGKSIGLLTGNEKEKLEPFFVQTIDHLKKFLGVGYVNAALGKETIQTKAFEYIRGMSFENTIVIAEEVQTLAEEEFETLLTRIGNGCQMILTGDSRQVNRGQESGLDSTFKMIEDAVKQAPMFLDDEDLDSLEDNFGIVRFTPEDIVRSGVVKALVKLYYYK